MTVTVTAHDQLREELQRLRLEGLSRASLSEHACHRLFFEIGVRPTVASVRELTGTGSAGDIARDIEDFWQHMRRRGRDEALRLPPGIQQRAEELVRGLYDAAIAEVRSEHAISVTKAENEVRQGIERQRILEEELESLRARCLEQAAQLAQHHHSSDLGGTVQQVLQEYADGERTHLLARLDASEATNATLRQQIGELQAELAARATDYAAQLKDALAAAEARVRPLLVELDTLRQRIAAADRAAREAPRREFEWMQQLSQARAQVLEAQQRAEQAQAEVVRAQQSRSATGEALPAKLGEFLAELIAQGRVPAEAVRPVGQVLDPYISPDIACPQCEAEETDLSVLNGKVEIVCGACGHHSGLHASRALALAHFVVGLGVVDS